MSTVNPPLPQTTAPMPAPPRRNGRVLQYTPKTPPKTSTAAAFGGDAAATVERDFRVKVPGEVEQ